MNKISRIVAKTEVQKMIKALRGSGLTVDKIEGGYVCEARRKIIFKAMNGSNGYLVRMADDLFI